MENETNNSHPSTDTQPNDILTGIEVYDRHDLKKIRFSSKMFKTCSICALQKKWPWTSIVMCKGCKMICHRRCLNEVNEICPSLAARCNEGPSMDSAISNSPSIVVNVKELDEEKHNGLVAEESVAVHDYNVHPGESSTTKIVS